MNDHHLDPDKTILSVRDILTAMHYIQWFCNVQKRSMGCDRCWFQDDVGKYCFFKTFYPYEWDKYKTEKKHKGE